MYIFKLFVLFMIIINTHSVPQGEMGFMKSTKMQLWKSDNILVASSEAVEFESLSAHLTV